MKEKTSAIYFAPSTLGAGASTLGASTSAFLGVALDLAVVFLAEVVAAFLAVVVDLLAEVVAFFVVVADFFEVAVVDLVVVPVCFSRRPMRFFNLAISLSRMASSSP